MKQKTKQLKIRSMTGMGTARTTSGACHHLVEIRSVNNRYLDISLRLPNGWNSFESEIRSLCQKYVKRGKVNILASTVSSTSGGDEVKLNDKKLIQYHDYFSKLSKKMGLAPLKLNDLIRLPQVLEVKQEEVITESGWKSLKQTIIKALKSLNLSREREGKKLRQDFLKRLSTLKKLISLVEKQRSGKLKEVHAKLFQKIKKLTESVGINDDRLAKEAAFLTEKSDISEELVRLKSHLDLFKRILEEPNEVGKKLDFTLQELNREANTIASKANHFGMSRLVIDIKAEIEKLREQVQNIE